MLSLFLRAALILTTSLLVSFIWSSYKLTRIPLCCGIMYQYSGYSFFLMNPLVDTSEVFAVECVDWDIALFGCKLEY